MKNVKLLMFAFTAMLFLGIGNVSGQEKEPQTVMMSVIGEFKGSEMSLNLIVISPDGSDYEVSMEKRTLKNRKESFIANTKIIQSEINKWKQKGYKIDQFEILDSDDIRYIIMSKV
jgi:hypothetical protein